MLTSFSKKSGYVIIITTTGEQVHHERDAGDLSSGAKKVAVPGEVQDGGSSEESAESIRGDALPQNKFKECDKAVEEGEQTEGGKKEVLPECKSEIPVEGLEPLR